ncbi:MAG: hypothetical protein EXR72_01730 [Myxococcales bacterium]|nr:hypothetical protein [Myxococcales bacterium]
MIKICPDCHSTWAGGQRCEDCGGVLRDPFGAEAKELPPSMWGYIRLQYGARRGMLVRVMAILLAPVTFGATLRSGAGCERPWSIVLGVVAFPVGFLTWWSIHWLAGRAVRIWVLRKGQVNKRRLVRALARRALRPLGAPDRR